VAHKETAEKEVQDSSCRGSGGVPRVYLFPPLLEERGTGGEVNEDSDVPQIIANPDLSGMAISASHHHPDCFVASAPRNDGEKQAESDMSLMYWMSKKLLQCRISIAYDIMYNGSMNEQ
jgi:hypothetical protein